MPVAANLLGVLLSGSSHSGAGGGSYVKACVTRGISYPGPVGAPDTNQVLAELSYNLIDGNSGSGNIWVPVHIWLPATATLLLQILNGAGAPTTVVDFHLQFEPTG